MDRSTVLHAPASTPLIERLRTRQARVGVIGLGYVGLPLAVEFAHAGFTVTPVDLDQPTKKWDYYISRWNERNIGSS